MSEERSIRCEVAEGMSRDVGRAIARLHPEDMDALGVAPGEILELVGSRPVLARAMPTPVSRRQHGVVLVDGVVRDNASLGIGHEVAIQPCPMIPPARSVEFIPLGKAPSDEDLEYVGSVVDGIPVRRGDRVRVTFFGSRILDFEVGEVSPQTGAVIASKTQLFVGDPGAHSEEHAPRRSEPKVGGRLTYEDIGGLSSQLTKIRETVELPLKNPMVFEQLGIGAPKGILLHGPPGCGKTLVAKVIADEAHASFHPISGPEIIQKFYGESEAALRAVFEKARSESPAIIFLDEIDAIAPKREDAGGDVERRVVAQLLTLMDGLQGRGEVLVLAATNRPNALDPALRRPGRFDREIAIPVPDRRGRLEVLKIHSRGMPLHEDVSLEHLAAITHGYVGADLEALCREAAMATLRRTMELDGRVGSTQLTSREMEGLVVHGADFMEAYREVKPTATREVFVEVPDVRWEDIGGLKATKAQLEEAVEWPLRYASLFAAARVRPSRGILMVGPPGCGKTMMARAAATETQANFISVKGPAMMDKFVGGAERNVREIFLKAKQASPCIIFFDEIDAIAPARGSTVGDSGAVNRVLAQLLTELDGVEELKGVLVLAATNRADMIDEALLRPGRFDEIIQIDKPDEVDRASIFEVHLRDKPTGPDVEVADLARQTAEFVGSEIAEVVRRAAMHSMRALIDAAREGGSPNPDDLSINKFQLLKAIEAMRQRP